MEAGSSELRSPKLLLEDGHLRKLASALGLAYLLPLGCSSYASVFKARSAGGAAVAVKCLAIDETEGGSKRERRAQRERDMARWAAERGLGPPILRHAVLPLFACLVMPCADSDLQLFWQRRAHVASLETLRHIWSDAFALVTAEELCDGRWIGADLKPANVLLYRARPGWKVCLNDFDAHFWHRAASCEAARLLNIVILLSNALFLLPMPAIVPHLPGHVTTLLRRLLRDDDAVLAVLQANIHRLRRGLLHYSGAKSLDEHLKLLHGRAALHGHVD